MREAPDRARAIRLLVLDVDGVLTDGSLLVGDDGVEHKRFSVYDGLGIKMVMEAGLEVAVISGRSSRAVSDRLAELGVSMVYQGQADKIPVFDSMIRELGMTPSQCAYVGDDLQDLALMGRVGLAIAVANAHYRVRESAHFVSSAAGGKGAVREICEFILQAQGRLESAFQRYLPGDAPEDPPEDPPEDAPNGLAGMGEER